MEPIKFPVVSTLILFALAGLLTFYMPLPNLDTDSSVTTEMFH